MGFPVIRDCNFKNPVILPEKVTDPISILIKMLTDIRLNEIVLLTLIISENAIKDDANPPSPLKIATICGMEVICTFLANINPKIPPVVIPKKI